MAQQTNKSNSIKINSLILEFNNSFADKLNGVVLSFTGDIRKEYQIYFKDSCSGKIEAFIFKGKFLPACNAIDILSSVFINLKKIVKE